MSFKMCKHSNLQMFIDKIKVIEPSSYPTVDAGEKFEDKLSAEIAEVAQSLLLIPEALDIYSTRSYIYFCTRS